jgi:dTDP-4-dehydrorhamnose reductase
LPESGYVIRTSWLYGKGGSTFPNKILQAWRNTGKVTISGINFGQPTWAKTLSKRILSLALSEAPAGIFHITGKGSASRLSYAQTLFRSLRLPVLEIEQDNGVFTGARRPRSTILIPTQLDQYGLEEMPDWDDDLGRAVNGGIFNGF